NATVDGLGTTVDAQGKPETIDASVGTYTETYAPSSFDPSTAVTDDTSGDEIDLGYDPGFPTGEEVVYDNGGGGTIGGLTSGPAYFVILDATNTPKIKLAATPTDALNGTPRHHLGSTCGHFQQSFRTPGASPQSFNAAAAPTGAVLPGSSANLIKVDATNLNTGDAVIYHNGGGGATSIPGLIEGNTYYVIKISN